MSGAVIKAAKADNPLQLVNPLAPARYGYGEASLSLEPITRETRGIILFNLSF